MQEGIVWYHYSQSIIIDIYFTNKKTLEKTETVTEL